MSTSSSASYAYSVPTSIHDQLRRIRTWKVALGLLSFAVLGLTVLVVGMLLAMLLDWLTLPGNEILRPWLTGFPMVAAVAVIIAGAWRVLYREIALGRAASDVDAANPALEERWATVSEVALADDREVHPAMFRLLSKEAAAWVPRVAPRQVISRVPLVRSIVVFSVAMIVLLFPMLIDHQRTMMLIERFWSPRTDITLTQFEGLPTELVVAQGETAVLGAQLSGRIPEHADLTLRSVNGVEKQFGIKVDDALGTAVSYRVPEVESSFSFRWQAGDAQSAWLPVAAAKRPKIAAVRFEVTPPAYTKRPVARRNELPSRALVVEGSVLNLAFRSSELLKELRLEFGEEKNQKLKVDADGWYRWQTEVKVAFAFSPVLVETHGLTNDQIRGCRVQVYRDQAPVVNVVSPTAEMAVQPTDEVDIQFVASDDFAVNRAELIVYGQPNSETGTNDKDRQELKTIPIDLGAMQGAKKVEGAVKLNLGDFGLSDGQSISYAVRVYDNRVAPTPPTAGKAAPLATANRETANAGDPSAPSSKPAANANAQSGTSPSPPSANTSSPPSANAVAGTSGANNEEESEKRPPVQSNQSSENAVPAPPGTVAEAEPNKTVVAPQSSAADPAPSANSLVSGSNPRAASPMRAPMPANPSAATSPAPSMPPAAQSTSSAPSAASPNAGVKSTQKPNAPTTVATSSGTSRAKSADSPTTPPNKATVNNATTNNVTPKNNASATSNQGKLVASTNADKYQNAESNPAADVQTSANRGENGKVAVPEGMVPMDKKNDAPQNNVASGDSQNEPGNSMTKRLLDLPQSGSSSQMKLKIERTAGSFDGQRREKLALAISPVLSQLDDLLAEAEKLTDGVAVRLERKEAWTTDGQRQADRAEKLLERGEQLVAELQKKSANTPYAFIGLQLSLIAQTHLSPARDSLWEAQQADAGRLEAIRSAWQEITRARTELSELTKTFERIHREHKLAEAAQKIKQMYQVFVEDSLALLQPQKNGINDYERKIAEFELDEEYLKRLKEVLRMRRDLQAELARLLTEDPRLMRRFMDRLKSRGDTLRDQLTLLSEQQKQLSREVQAWASAGVDARPALLEAIIRMRQSHLEEIALLAAAQNEKFISWLPLDLAADNSAFRESLEISKAVAAQSQLLAHSPADYAARNQTANELYNQLAKLDASLRQVDLGTEHEQLANHLLNRLADVRKLTLLISSWMKQAELLNQGNYWDNAAIEQYKLAMETDALAGKLADIETQLSSMVMGDSKATSDITTKARALLTTLDKELSANQLAATFALRHQEGQASVEKETAAVAAFEKAEALFDDVMKTVINELDKQPVQDPIASLLEDPTLDELLAQLENEVRLEEVLGIPNRPSNLRIIQDWMQPNNRGGGGGRMITAQLRRDANRARENAEEAYRKALARALKEQDGVELPKPSKLATSGPRVEWNKLLSTLDDELLQGRGELLPQEYRQAIEQYMTRISRIENSQTPAEKSD